MSIKDQLKQREREIIAETLKQCAGGVRAAAEVLGEPERTLWHRIKRLSIDPDSYRINDPESRGVAMVRSVVDGIARTMMDSGAKLSPDIDAAELSERLYVGGFLPNKPQTSQAAMKALMSGSYEHI